MEVCQKRTSWLVSGNLNFQHPGNFGNHISDVSSFERSPDYVVFMKNVSSEILKDIVPVLVCGGVGVLPTDTLYGLVGSALNEKTVEKIYKLRKRNRRKPLIILISRLRDLELFDVRLTTGEKKVLKNIWPGKVSIVFSCENKKFEYLHRGQKSLAFRLSNEKWLAALLKKTGPLVAPSANFEGEMPAQTIKEAKKYFGSKVDFYVDAGNRHSKPSTLVKLEKGKLEILREGAVRIKI